MFDVLYIHLLKEFVANLLVTFHEVKKRNKTIGKLISMNSQIINLWLSKYFLSLGGIIVHAVWF